MITKAQLDDTKAQLEEWKALCEAATPEPWEWRSRQEDGHMLIHPRNGMFIIMDFVRRKMQGAQPRFSDRGTERKKLLGGVMQTADEIGNLYDNPDAKFIAASRSALPALIDWCEQLTASIDQAHSNYDRLLKDYQEKKKRIAYLEAENTRMEEEIYILNGGGIDIIGGEK